MNWDRVEGEWKNVKGKAREKWGKLTDSDWEQVAGKKDQLVGKLQERYGMSRDQAEKECENFAGECAHQPAGSQTGRERQRKVS